MTNYIDGFVFPIPRNHLNEYRRVAESISEFSQLYNAVPEWSGYYFDALGDPCAEDTVALAVFHIIGFLSGAEIIQWYKNDTLLPFMTNEDTFLISEEGSYEVKVVDPNSICPVDTSFYIVEYECIVLGFAYESEDQSWSLFPNSTSEYMIVKNKNDNIQAQIEIYNVLGRLVMVKEEDIFINDVCG